MNEKILIQKLKDWGCDTDGALERVLQDEELYISLIKRYNETIEIDKLKECLEENKCQEAFDTAHSIKGVSANLGLTPIYNAVVRLVEPLRSGSCCNLNNDFTELLQKKKEFSDIIEKCK